ncbi:MAG TPA: cyclic nucleotide-binding domain-containing protein [Syntrophales bacterium]|nr:cyclic nucleotide-binding domain-containing protein [Syntrophobacterales bacterium]HRR39900.1 cyclic nucleotide-binding domain-containing protein [Syntrophales bacterium]HRT27361.1 cyclic nucleotide-binding domain-containing protein [Syntrophales bacterium]HRT70096.1 cyclic nucleotide-binding domain-containing protein [Syntrophales bacterium]
MENVIDILRHSVIFSKLTDEQLKKLAAIASIETHPAGTVLYREGDPAAKFYIVIDGKVALDMQCDMGPNFPPRQVIVDVVAKGESMGWSAVVEPFIFTLSCLCLDRTELVAIDAVKLRGIIDEDCEMGLAVMKAVAKMIATRLTHTRVVLVGERALGIMTEHTQYA